MFASDIKLNSYRFLDGDKLYELLMFNAWINFFLNQKAIFIPNSTLISRSRVY